ncbi:MAG TPA: hypothetical protein VGB87_22560 [Vicinamibacteria bacterium]
MSEGPSLDALEHGDFARHLGTPFRLRLPSGEALDLTLVEATLHPDRSAVAARRKGFSLVFRDARPGHLPQGTYRLDHEEMGTLEIFLVPIGPLEGGMGYEAVFN